MAEYKQRQSRLMATLPPKSLVIVPAAHKSFVTHDIPYRFRQSSDFHYLCGYPEEEAVLLIQSGQDPTAQPTATLLVRGDRSPSR